jgi:hypothetical protein
MARQRRTATPTVEPQNERKEVKRMAGLTPEEIKALLGKARQKGVYEQHLIEFVKSGEGGVNVKETWADMDKKATTLKQGFENAKDKAHVMEQTDGAAGNVKVIVSDENVFLINLGAVEAEAA